MASLLQIVRLVTMILIGVAFIMVCLELVQSFDTYNRNVEAITYLVIALVILFIGGYGSYYNHRTYLMGFALIMIIAIILGFVSKAQVMVSLGFCVATIVLTLVQSELLRRSF